ncbi:hypothetical protein VHUM_01514 [Vanrija humicola]|uniref:DASH complex subunit DAD1 n=1 Tax=Vanrija humicola TaxID=5417 RepID=A0A7D8Z5X1_VANHU|nr:hypothetical protein VHUM_01514 [Vanrija humicola]
MSTSQQPAAEPDSYFERERQKLIQEISSGFEDFLTHTNVLNRTLEEVYGVGKDFNTVAELWGQFQKMAQTKPETTAETGVPGTGGRNFGASVAR